MGKNGANPPKQEAESGNGTDFYSQVSFISMGDNYREYPSISRRLIFWGSYPMRKRFDQALG